MSGFIGLHKHRKWIIQHKVFLFTARVGFIYRNLENKLFKNLESKLLNDNIFNDKKNIFNDNINYSLIK